MEAGCDEVSDIDDLINLTFNLDCYDIMPGINDESDLGYYYAHEAGIYSEKDGLAFFPSVRRRLRRLWRMAARFTVSIPITPRACA
jgi:hypothetical protein